jgi:5'-nucleotidase
MKLLLTNDDGIDALGLQALTQAIAGLGQVIVAAPADAHSGCSHRVTTREPIRVVPRDTIQFAIHGTPADCVRAGLHDLAPDANWVLAGINEGGNLGADVYHSGTVAAVREAVLHGYPGIALSHYVKRTLPLDWTRAAGWARPLLTELFQKGCPPGCFWNVNLPHLEPGVPMPEVVVCPLDSRPLPLSYRRDGDQLHYNGNYHQRRRDPGSDVDVCFNGKIAVTLLRLY